MKISDVLARIKLIRIVNEDEFSVIVDEWCENRTHPKRLAWICRNNNGTWTCADNEDDCMWCEDFNRFLSALRWQLGLYEDTDLLD